jgi:hypothetical protein
MTVEPPTPRTKDDEIPVRARSCAGHVLMAESVFESP